MVGKAAHALYARRVKNGHSNVCRESWRGHGGQRATSVAGTHSPASDTRHALELGQLQCMRATTMHDRTYIRAHSCTQGVAPKASVPQPRIWTGTDC